MKAMILQNDWASNMTEREVINWIESMIISKRDVVASNGQIYVFCPFGKVLAIITK